MHAHKRHFVHWENMCLPFYNTSRFAGKSSISLSMNSPALPSMFIVSYSIAPFIGELRAFRASSLVTLPRAFLSHLVSNCSFSFVLKQGYYENSLILGKKVLISLFYCDLSNGQIYRILVWNVSIVLHCSLFTSANSLTQATIKYR